MKASVSKTNRNRKKFRVVPLLAFAAAPAGAALLTWSNGFGGIASTAGNWSPAQVPTATDDLVFNLANNYAITFNAGTAASNSQKYRSGNVTVTTTAAHNIQAGGMVVGDQFGDNATMALTTGSLTSLGTVFVGRTVGTTGVLIVNDDDARLETGPGVDMFVASSGTGALDIIGGGHVQVGDQFSAGANAAGSAAVHLSSFNVPGPQQSRLDVLSAGLSFMGRLGDATATIESGALAHFAGTLSVANDAGSVSSVTIQGTGALGAAALEVGSDLSVGRNTTAGSAAGAATVNVSAGGRLQVDQTLFLGGDPDGGTGTLHMADGGEITAHSLSIGTGSALDLAGGDLFIDGGTLAFTDANSTFRIGGPSQRPNVLMQNGATANLAPAIPLGAVSLLVANGNFNLRSGAELTISGAGDLLLGELVGENSGMTLRDPGTSLTLGSGSDLVIGVNGFGVLQTSDCPVVGDRLFMAKNPGSSASARIELENGIAQFNSIFVGGTATDPGGIASLRVVADGTLSVPGPGSGEIRIWPTSLLEVSHATVDAPTASIVAFGELSLDQAAVCLLDTVLVNSGGRIHTVPASGVAPVIQGNVILNPGGQIVLDNDLEAGTDTGDVGFFAQTGSSIAVRSHALTMHDTGRATVGTVTMSGGSLVAENGIQIANNGSIDGTGTIVGDIHFDSGASVITATGAGITINGLLTNNSGSIDGTHFLFDGVGGGWTGGGAILAPVEFRGSTKVIAQSNILLGANDPNGVTFLQAAELHARNRAVTLVDSNGIGLPIVTDVNGGQIICAQQLVANPNRRLSGRGSIDSPNVIIAGGELSPGELAGEVAGETGELTINGNLSLNNTAITNIEIQGLLQPAEYDRVVVNGVATLGGTLNVSFLNGFNPPLGSAWSIMEYDSKVGNFANINIAPGSPSCVFVSVSDTAVIVTRGLIADLDHDGDVDISDLALLLSNFGCIGGVENPCPIDLDGNGDTDISDLAILLSNFGQTCS